MAGIAEVKTRIETILTDIPGLTVLSGDERRVARMTLPAAAVRVRNATRQNAGSRSAMTTRQFGVLLMVAQVKSELDEDVQDAFDLVYPWLVTIPDKMVECQGLRLNALGPIVHATGAIEDSGPITFPYKELIYAGAGFTIPVTMIER